MKPLKKYNINNYMILTNKIISLLPNNLIIDEKYDYHDELNIDLAISIMKSFLNDYDPKLLNMFKNIYELDSNSFKLISKDTIEEDFNSRINLDTGIITIPLNNNITDIFHLVHEFIHKVDYRHTSNYIKNFSNFGEVIPITFELYLFNYLISNGILINDSINYLKNRFKNNIEICYLMKFIEFINENYNENITDFARNYIEIEEFKLKINKLPENVQKVFINNFDYFRLIINWYGEEINNYLFSNLRYNYAILLAPYLYKINDKKLLESINKYAYSNQDNNIEINIDLACQEFKLFINELFNKENKKVYNKKVI